MEIKVYDRRQRRCTVEKQYGGGAVEFLYETAAGRLLLWLFVSGRLFSRLCALRDRLPSSVKRIRPFIKEYRIKMSDFEAERYRCYADFFTRRVKRSARPIDGSRGSFVAVADSKLSCYEIDDSLCLEIKGGKYTVGELIGDEKLARVFAGGTALVFRLTVDDCHRYCFPSDGRLISRRRINGRLHTVRPIAQKRYRVFSENSREIALLDTDMFGEIIQLEVGALLVGKITNNSMASFKKGDEKGFFELGGSTCVLLLKRDAVRIDGDILAHSAAGIETRVLMGERIGTADA